MHEDFLEKLNEDNILDSMTILEILSVKDILEHNDLYNKVFSISRKFGLAKKFEQVYKKIRFETIKKNKGHEDGRSTEFTDQPVVLRCGNWVCDDNGVKCEEFSQNHDTTVFKIASPIPIMPVEILKNIDTDTEKIVLAYYSNFEWHRITCERVTVASNTKIIELANRGIEVTSENAKLLVRYISDMITLNPDIISRNKAVSRMGWLDSRFLPYDKEIKFDGERENRSLYEAISSKGTADKWIEYIKPMIQKSKLLRLAVASSFASVLISRVNALPFVFHLWGGTGSGKTVGLMVAMSIWGNPKLGAMSRTMNMTPNSMMTTAAFLRNIPFGGDELQIIKDKFGSYDRLIMSITEGIERGRMTYDKNNEMKTWACSFLFTGEEPCTKSYSGGGVINRVIEAEATEKLIEDGNAVVTFINENYGTVGKIFVDIVRQTKDIAEIYSVVFKYILSKIDTTEKQAMAAALILSADYLASTKIFNIEPLTVDDIKPYLSSIAEVDISERAYAFVVDIVAKHEQSHFKQAFRDEPVREIWGKLDDDSEGNDFVMINKTVLTKLLSDEGYDFEAVKTKWAEKGYLIKNSEGRYMHHTKCYGIKATYIKIRLLDDDCK